MDLESKTYKEKWLAKASKNLDDALTYVVSTSGEAAAKALAAKIYAAVDQILSNPSLSKAGRVSGTREKIVSGTSYLIPYRVVGNEVQILRVFHTRQKPPKRW